MCPFWCGEAERWGEGEDGLRLERALLPLGPSCRRLGLTLPGDLEPLSSEESEALWELQELRRCERQAGDSLRDLLRSLFFSFRLFLGLRDLCLLFFRDPDSDLSRLCFFPVFFFFSLRMGEELSQLRSEPGFLFLRLRR